MAKRVMISQPRYLPSLNYLRRIAQSDLFVILDDTQRTERGWENRNMITDKNGGGRWLTIPVKGSSRLKINEAQIDGCEWIQDHVNKFVDWLGMKDEMPVMWYFDPLERLCEREFSYGVSLSVMLSIVLRKYRVETEIVKESTLNNVQGFNGKDKILQICKEVGAEEYVTGRFGAEYGIDRELFDKSGINVVVDEWRPNVYSNDNDHNAFLEFDIKFGMHKVQELLGLQT